MPAAALQKFLDRADDLLGHRRRLRCEARGDLAGAVDEEFGEVPLNVARPVRLRRLPGPVDGIRLEIVDGHGFLMAERCSRCNPKDQERDFGSASVDALPRFRWRSAIVVERHRTGLVKKWMQGVPSVIKSRVMNQF